MFEFIVGLYIGGFIVEAATEFCSLPDGKISGFAYAGAVWPYSILRAILRALAS